MTTSKRCSLFMLLRCQGTHVQTPAQYCGVGADAITWQVTLHCHSFMHIYPTGMWPHFHFYQEKHLCNLRSAAQGASFISERLLVSKAMSLHNSKNKPVQVHPSYFCFQKHKYKQSHQHMKDQGQVRPTSWFVNKVLLEHSWACPTMHCPGQFLCDSSPVE